MLTLYSCSLRHYPHNSRKKSTERRCHCVLLSVPGICDGAITQMALTGFKAGTRLSELLILRWNKQPYNKVEVSIVHPPSQKRFSCHLLQGRPTNVMHLLEPHIYSMLRCQMYPHNTVCSMSTVYFQWEKCSASKISLTYFTRCHRIRSQS